MARFIVAALFVILPAVLSTSDSGRSLYAGQQGAATGSGSFNNVNAAQESHNKKNIGFNIDLDRGQSSSYNANQGQAALGVIGQQAVGTHPSYLGGYPYPSYPYPGYYPHYPSFNPLYQGIGAASHSGPGGAGVAVGGQQVIPRY